MNKLGQSVGHTSFDVIAIVDRVPCHETGAF
jgi:hypothetical protein